MTILILVVKIGCDQTTKLAARKTLRDQGTIRVIGDFFILRYAENEGAFLSLGSKWPKQYRVLALIILPATILTIVVFGLLRSPKLNVLQLIAFSCIAGGGFSNLLDRLLYKGFVIDFMNLGIRNVRTGIFNFADLSIVFGIALLAFIRKKEKSN